MTTVHHDALMPQKITLTRMLSAVHSRTGTVCSCKDALYSADAMSEWTASNANQKDHASARMYGLMLSDCIPHTLDGTSLL
jgi:hypothetical protein